MNRALRSLRSWLALFVLASCSGDRAPANDTATPDVSPREEEAPRARASTWNAAAGSLFAVHSTGAMGWLINPAYGDDQGLDTLTAGAWNVEGTELALIDGAQVVGASKVTELRYDSTCAGWPTASLLVAPPSVNWRVAFPAGTVEGLSFDSLPAVSAADSAARARDGALAASRLPDDTISAFRGRPFIVRQANRFASGTDTLVTIYEVVRLVAQEANPLQEQILILTEKGSSGPAEDVFHEREVATEEAMGSVELLAVLRIRSTGRVAILVRRERESGFQLEWIERSSRGRWFVRWRSAVDSC